MELIWFKILTIGKRDGIFYAGHFPIPAHHAAFMHSVNEGIAET